MQEHMPLICALRTAGMKDRHWDLVGEEAGQSLRPDTSSLKLLLQLGVEKHLLRIQVIPHISYIYIYILHDVFIHTEKHLPRIQVR